MITLWMLSAHWESLTEMEVLKKVCVVGGGTGNALAFPVACGMHAAGIEVDMIAGYKSKEHVILEDEFRAGTGQALYYNR